MAKYRILVRNSVYKDIESIPQKDLKRIIKAIAGLAENPRPPQSTKLSFEEKYKLRCGLYRVIYEIHEAELVVYM